MNSPSAELAAAKIKIENISSEVSHRNIINSVVGLINFFQLRQVQAQLDVKNGSIHELRSKVQLLNENDARQSVLLQAGDLLYAQIALQIYIFLHFVTSSCINQPKWFHALFYCILLKRYVFLKVVCAAKTFYGIIFEY